MTTGIGFHVIELELEGDPGPDLTADVNGNRTVDRPDKQKIGADKNQVVTSVNFRDDINLSGVVDKLDVQLVETNRGHSIP